jgi:hypothetical protein
MLSSSAIANPLQALSVEASIEVLGSDYWDVVEAGRFPCTQLRFRNDALLRQLGLEPAVISNCDLEAAYGRFETRTPLLARRFHGYQFGHDSATTTPSWAVAALSSLGRCVTAMDVCTTWQQGQRHHPLEPRR